MVATFNSLQHTHGIQETTLVELMITFEFFKIVMIYNAKYGLCDISGHFGGYGSFVWVHPGRPQQERVQHGPEAGILRVPRMERRLHDDQRQLHRDAGGLGRYPPPASNITGSDVADITAKSLWIKMCVKDADRNLLEAKNSWLICWFFSATQSVWSSPSGCEGNRQNANSGKLLELYGWGLKTYKYSVGTSAMFSTISIFFFYFSWPRQSMWNIHGKSVIRWIPSNSSCWTTTTLSSVAEISPQSEWHHVSGKLYARYRKWEPLKVTQKWQCHYLFWIFSRLFNILWIFLFYFLSIMIFFLLFVLVGCMRLAASSRVWQSWRSTSPQVMWLWTTPCEPWSIVLPHRLISSEPNSTKEKWSSTLNM